MSPESKPPKASLLSEVRNIYRHGQAVWKMTSPERKRTLRLASLVMVITSLANAAVPVLLGGLVDAMQGRVPNDAISSFPISVFGLDDRIDAERDAAFPQADAEGESDAPSNQFVRLTNDLLFKISIVYLSVIAFSYLLRESLRVVQRFMVQDTTSRIEKETAVNLVGHLLKSDLGTLSQERIGALHGRIHRSVEGYVKFLKITFMDFWPSLSMAGFALLAAVLKQPWLALVMLGVVPVSMLITARQLASQKGIRVELNRSKEGLDATVVEQLGGIEYIRAANTHDLETARINTAAEARRKKSIFHHTAMALFDCAKSLNEGLFHILVISLAIYLAAIGKISFGDIIAFSGLFASVMAPMREIHRIIDEGHESSIQVDDLLKMMNQPTDASFSLPTIRWPSLKTGDPAIATSNLIVEYRTRDGQLRKALDRVTIDIKHGESIGVAGRSGCGKTTWLKVILRLVHPTSGIVVLGGEPIQSISREVIGKTLGYVSQTPFVFSGTVEENIAYGNGEVGFDRIRHAAEMAAIHDEIMAMPQGYQTQLTERGQNLSGGQRQRIALARMFLKDPPILILDEGTSALDNISERHVQRAIAEARSERTVITVAHRLTTLRDADRIFVFDEGRIVEVGTYDELVAKDGIFMELVRSGQESAAG